LRQAGIGERCGAHAENVSTYQLEGACRFSAGDRPDDRLMFFARSRLAPEWANAVNGVAHAVHVPHQVLVSLAQDWIVGALDDGIVKVIVEFEVAAMIAFLQGNLHELIGFADLFEHLGWARACDRFGGGGFKQCEYLECPDDVRRVGSSHYSAYVRYQFDQTLGFENPERVAQRRARYAELLTQKGFGQTLAGLPAAFHDIEPELLQDGDMHRLPGR